MLRSWICSHFVFLWYGGSIISPTPLRKTAVQVRKPHSSGCSTAFRSSHRLSPSVPSPLTNMAKSVVAGAITILLAIAVSTRADQCQPSTCQGRTIFHFNNTACSGSPISYEGTTSPDPFSTCMALTTGSQIDTCSNPSGSTFGSSLTTFWYPSTSCSGAEYYSYSISTGLCVLSGNGQSTLAMCSVNDTIPTSTGNVAAADSSLTVAPSTVGSSCSGNDPANCQSSLFGVTYSNSDCSGSVVSTEELYPGWTTNQCYYNPSSGLYSPATNQMLTTSSGQWTIYTFNSGCEGTPLEQITYYFGSNGLGPCASGSRYGSNMATSPSSASSTTPSLLSICIALLLLALASAQM